MFIPRSKSVSINEVGFQFRILKAVDEEKSHIDFEGKVIYGLHLEGARWAEEKGELDEALHKVRTNESMYLEHRFENVPSISALL